MIVLDNGQWKHPCPERIYLKNLVKTLNALYESIHPEEGHFSLKVDSYIHENVLLHLLAYKLRQLGYPREGIGDNNLYTLFGKVTVGEDGTVMMKSSGG